MRTVLLDATDLGEAEALVRDQYAHVRFGGKHPNGRDDHAYRANVD